MCPSLASESSQTTTPDHDTQARWVAHFAQGWRSPGSADAFARHFRPLLAEDIRLIQPQLPMLVGRGAFERRFVRPVFALIPDLHGEVERWAAQGETIYIELVLRGTLGGRPLSWRVCDRVTLRDGLAVERESYFDPAPLVRALATRPRAWPRYLRARAATLIKRPARRRKR